MFRPLHNEFAQLWLDGLGGQNERRLSDFIGHTETRPLYGTQGTEQWTAGKMGKFFHRRSFDDGRQMQNESPRNNCAGVAGCYVVGCDWTDSKYGKHYRAF